MTYDNTVDAKAPAVQRITGTGAYPGTCEIPFTISPADIAATDVEVSQLLADEPSSPATKLTFNGKTLQEGVDYCVSYAGGDVPGPAVATIEGLGNFRGNDCGELHRRERCRTALPARKRPILRR